MCSRGRTHFPAERNDAPHAFSAEDGVDERPQPCSGGEMLGLEFLRMSEMIAKLLDVAREAVSFASRLNSERRKTGAVAYKDVGLVFDLETIKQDTFGPAALALCTKRDSFFQA